MNPWLYSLISVILVSLLSFVGVLFLAIKKDKLKKILLFLVSFAAGGGFSRKKALFFNFVSALTAVLGAILTLFLGTRFIGFIQLLIPFTAGGFIYIAGSDLIPELHKETNLAKSLVQMIGLILGIGDVNFAFY